MLRGHWSRKVLAPAVGGAAVVIVAVATAPASRSDDAALAGWLTKAFAPIEKIHTAENALIPILAPDPPNAGPDDKEKPLRDVNALKAPCDQLHQADVDLQGLLPTPDPELTAEIQQAVDNVDTAVENCTQVIQKPITDRKQARRMIKGPLYDAESHLASADIILAKLTTPK